MRAYAIPAEQLDGADVAVVGLAGRFPGAPDVFDFWRNLQRGVESIRRLSDDELRAAGVDGATLEDPNYVKASAILDRLELFDAGFFGFSKREASVLDPQHRHFLEVCFEALENAGVLPEASAESIGVFGGSGMNAYLPYNLFTNPELMNSMGLFLVRHTGNDKDFLTTRVSYCLNLKGPSINVQTACSTSLVAIHLAVQSLLAAECDIALAGGVTIELPHFRGYRYEEGEILSPDGHCRPFDEQSKGTVFGSGAGVVVLRRLRDAVERGDFIHAIIKGSAINNDGDRKVGYLAPSVDGQAECVVEALQVAGLSAREISYIECHGTGTPVGDPIEVTALCEAFSRSTTEKGFCGIGSVKSNIGHLDTAAGVASFIKVVQMLGHDEIAPTLHFEKPNPQIDFAASPFFVAGQSRRWPRTDVPRRAGVSSLGVGGTNGHVIVEEAPPRKPAAGRKNQPLLLTARSQKSLDAQCSRLARHFQENPELELSDVSSTLLFGRRRFGFRRALAASTLAEARTLLETGNSSRVFDARPGASTPKVVFLFPGGGAQHANMAREIYQTEPRFRESLDECFEIHRRKENVELLPLVFPEPGGEAAAGRELERPSLALPATLSIEIAFATLLRSWGITPSAMIGHSLGEYAAAHLASVLTLEAALGLMCCRGRLFERVKPGGMLSVPMTADALSPLLDGGLSIAAVNGPEMCVASGENASLDALQQKLAARDIDTRRLHIDIAAHSPLLDPILPDFRAYLEGIQVSKATLPYVSNFTGDFTDELLSRDYFVRHLRGTVRFSEGLAKLFAAYPDAIFIEVGPGQALTSLVRQHPSRRAEHAVIPLSPHARDEASQALHLMTSVGRILAHGGELDLSAVLGSGRRIVPLPPTPFEHERHWIEPGKGYFMAAGASDAVERETDVTRWFYTTVFREEPRAATNIQSGEYWMVIAEGPLANSLELEIKARGVDVVTLTPGHTSGAIDANHYSLKLSDPASYDDVIQAVFAARGSPRRILHTLCLSKPMLEADGKPSEALLDCAFYSLLHLLQVLGQEDLAGAELLVATMRAFDVASTSTLHPLHALAQGPVLVAQREIPDLRARILDLLDVEDVEAAARALVDELSAPSDHAIVAERARKRHVRVLERSTLASTTANVLPESPVVLLTGGLGGIARTLASHLAITRGARVVLLSRSKLPDQAEWATRRAALQANDPLAEQLDTLLELVASGHEVAVEQADVALYEQVEGAVQRVRARFGKIDVVVHAAGVLDDAPLALKDRAAAARVLAPKVNGTSNLVSALRNDPPKVLLLLSSTSAVLAPPGQIDYVAANAYVSAAARALNARWTGTRVMSLGFGVWRDTGMAARAMELSPPARGEPTGYPMLQREQKRDDGVLAFESLFEVSRLWVLDEHRVRSGGPVLPGTAIIEIMRAAGARALGLRPGEALEIRDAVFVLPLEVAETAPRLVEVTLTREERADGEFSIALSSRGRTDPAFVEHARAIVARTSASAGAPLPIADLEARCRVRNIEFAETRQVLPQDQHLAFGPRWRVLRTMWFGEGEALAHLELPERWANDLETYPLHPGMLDMASGFAFSLADAATSARVRVPLSYQHIRVFAPLTAKIVSFVRLRQGSDTEGVSVFDVRIADPSGRVLVEIDGYTTTSVAPSTISRVMNRPAEPSLLERWAKQGITRQEGAEVLDCLLNSNVPPEAYATPTSLFAMIDQLRGSPEAQRSEAAPASIRAGKTEPSAEGAPRDDVERRLAGMWQSLLGVDSVGIRDNFFELGGHSLIAVRLFARIKKAYGVDLPLAVLFQAPTIETCAELLRKELGIQFEQATEQPQNGEGTVAAAARALSHVVTIQKGNGSIPFFCVHGAGGNVLNFRDLAQRLGQAQQFLGLQARGVGGEEPAATIEEMADHYLPEIRSVWPKGPYLLGGYSGGGVVAYEIAQRLHAQGEDVPVLVFLDTFHPWTSARKPTLSERIQALYDEGPGYFSRRSKAKISRHLEELSSELRILYYSSQQLALPHDLRDLQLTRAFYQASGRYQPRPYPGAVTLYRARLIADIYQHVGPTLGWKDLIPKLDIVEVPGTHDSLVLEPNVQIVTAHLSSVLEQVARKLHTREKKANA